MGIRWNRETQKWDKTLEKTNYPTNLNQNLPESRYVTDFTETYTGPHRRRVKSGFRTWWDVTWSWQVGERLPDGTTKIVSDEKSTGRAYGKKWDDDDDRDFDDVPWEWNEDEDDTTPLQDAFEMHQNDKYNANNWNQHSAPSNRSKNANNKKTNDGYRALNEQGKALNAQYNKLENTAAATDSGEYLAARTKLTQAGLPNGLIEEFKEFYRDKKLKKWDSKDNKEPPYGVFDAKYYKSNEPQGRTALANWNNAVKNDNIDITENYNSEKNYLHYHYSTQGKPNNARGNKIENLVKAKKYQETVTDADKQAIRDRQLGIDFDTATERLLNIPYISQEWEKAKNGDSYWRGLGKERFLDVEKPDEFAALFRISERDADKQVQFANNVNYDKGVITELEDVITGVVGDEAIVETKKFGALTQDVLQETIDEIKKAKLKEEELDLISGLSGFKEIFDINETLTDSLFGSSGVGGILPFAPGGSDMKEQFEKSVGKISGVNRNESRYNWQAWFDETLAKRYDEALELGLTTKEAEEQLKIEQEFAQNFVTEYLVPRFDTSRSMDEFVEYIDVRQEEQNPFQTQSRLDAVRTLADTQANAYLDSLDSTRSFNADFYFNPDGDISRITNYATQTKNVNDDYDVANTNPNQLIDKNLPALGTWAQQIYRFGIGKDNNNKLNKNAFASMHYELLGNARGYDGAEDITNTGKVSDYIKSKVNALKQKAEEAGTVYGEFLTPEEFADDVLKGIDPDSDEFQEVLESVGLEDFEGTVEELKDYIIEALQTGSAQRIRENIKYLNEEGEDIDQETLGITYIEREEDIDKEQQKADTELYKIFQSAGYEGSENEFYDNFMTDVSREDQEILTAAARGKKFSFDYEGLSSNDPFEAFASISAFMPDDDKNKEEEEDEDKEKDKFGVDNSLFDLSLDIDEPNKKKSKSAESFLGDFTSGFTFT